MRALFCVSLALLSCGPGVHDLNAEGEPLFTVRARISGRPPAPQDALPNLRAALIWARVPRLNVFCLEHGPNPLGALGALGTPDVETSSVVRKACGDLLAFVPGITAGSVPITPDQVDIEIPLFQLPPSEALVGQGQDRVGYASLIIFDDRDGDGLLRQRISEPFACRDDEEIKEQVYAASFTSLASTNVRLVYREGEFDAESFFYPAIGCPPPSIGFSVWRLPSLLDQLADEPSDCINEPLAAGLTLSYASSTTALAQLPCPGFSGFPINPDLGDLTEGVEENGLTAECLDEDTWVVTDPSCACPQAEVLSLFGCRDLACTDLVWDLRNDIPRWWPCTEEQ